MNANVGMKPVSIIIAAATIAVAGTWAEKKKLNPRIIVGGSVLAIAFAFLQDAQPRLARDFAWLILVSTAGAFGEGLFTAVGDVTSGLKKVSTDKEIPEDGIGGAGGHGAQIR